MSLRFYLYLRKSSESEDRQQASIPAQERELLDLARRRSLNIVGEPFRETMSAKRPGRPLFEAMLAGLASKQADGILCWHLDRLARNPLDGGRVMQALGDKVIKEIITPGRSYTNADDKLMMAIEFGMSTKYVDDLARNVARGQRQALENGNWPGPPKLGYIRDYNINLLVPDPERFEAIQDIWRRKLQGEPVSEIYRRYRTLTTRARGKVGGGAITLAWLYNMFRDPFFAGILRYRGETHRGKHEPVVTWREFEAVQAMLTRGPTNTPKSYRHAFPYRGLIFCGRCRALVTAEYTTNHYGKTYTYYHCCRKSRTYGYCPERSVEGAKLDAQIAGFLAELVLPGPLAQALATVVPEVEAELAGNEAAVATRILAQVEQKKRELEKLRLLCARDVITPEELAADRDRIVAEQHALEDDLRSGRTGGLIELSVGAVSFANTALAAFQRGDAEERRAIVREVSSNLVLSERILRIEAKKSFGMLLHLKRNPELWASRDNLRTFLTQSVSNSDVCDVLPVAAAERPSVVTPSGVIAA